MRRRIAATLTLVCTVIATFVATADARLERDIAPPAVDAVDALALPEIDATVKLHCAGSVDDSGAGSVGCRWQGRDDLRVASWQLWNIQIRPEQGHRNLVAELRPHQTSYTDTRVEAPAAYLYAVLGLDANGRIIARSRPSAAVLGIRPTHEVLRLACRHGIADIATDVGLTDRARPDILPRPPVVKCEWSPSETRGAVGYVLYRSTDGGPREAVARTGLDVTWNVDHEVAFGHRYTYVVAAVDARGSAVALSHRVHVSIPPVFDPPDPIPVPLPIPVSDPVPLPPVDARPVDVKPVDVVPLDMRHDEAPERPVDDRPVELVGARPTGR